MSETMVERSVHADVAKKQLALFQAMVDLCEVQGIDDALAGVDWCVNRIRSIQDGRWPMKAASESMKGE